MENTVKVSWNEKILNRFHALAAKFDLPEDMSIEIEQFVMEVAREQFKVGNKSGIGWLRQKLGAKPGQLLQPLTQPEPQLA